MSWGGQELVGALVLFDLGVTESLLSGVTRGAGGGGVGGGGLLLHTDDKAALGT